MPFLLSVENPHSFAYNITIDNNNNYGCAMDNSNYMSVDESDAVMLLGQIYDSVTEFRDEKLIADNLRSIGITVTDNRRDRFQFVFYNGRYNCGIQFTGYYDDGWYYDLRRYHRYKVVHKEQLPAREEIVEYLILLTNAINIDCTLHKPNSQLQYTVTLNQRSLEYKPSIIVKDSNKQIVTSCTIRSLINSKHYQSVDFTGDVDKAIKSSVFNWANSIHPIAHVMWKTVAEIVWEIACLDKIKHNRIAM